MIGLSLSFCVGEIVRGEMDIGRVQKIITGTCAQDGEAWERLIAQYKKSYWSWCGCDPNRAEEVARQLLAQGKIEQPRLKDDGRYPTYLPGQYWVDSEDQIAWQESDN